MNPKNRYLANIRNKENQANKRNSSEITQDRIDPKLDTKNYWKLSAASSLSRHRDTFRVSILPGSISEGNNANGLVERFRLVRKGRIADGFGHALNPRYVFDVSPASCGRCISIGSMRGEIVHPAGFPTPNGQIGCTLVRVYQFFRLPFREAFSKRLRPRDSSSALFSHIVRYMTSL